MELGSGEVIHADVIIDCSGRHSCLPRWLERGGWQAPAVQRVDSHVVYASRHLKRPSGFDKANCLEALGWAGMKGPCVLVPLLAPALTRLLPFAGWL